MSKTWRSAPAASFGAPDLPPEQAEFTARSQVLAAGSVFNTPLTAAAWKTRPSWGVVASSDQIINPDLERWYYARAKSKTVELSALILGLREEE